MSSQMPTNDNPLYHLTIHEAQQLIQSRSLSPVELTRAFLQRIESVDDQLHAYLNLTAESALAEAQVAEAEILQGRYKGPLHGIPVAVKDQYDIKGIPATIRRKDSKDREGTEDSTVVSRLREAGAVLFGKLMMSSLPGEWPEPRNPWNLDYSPGGSSTGPGAAVAAGLIMGSLGEDTAGSIRNPASLSGIVGLKPTFGRVSRYGLAPLCWSLDHSGPMTWVVEDIAHMLQAIAGHDPKDFNSSHAPIPQYLSSIREDVKGMVVGVPRHYIRECQPHSDPEILAQFDKALKELESLGAHVEEITVPSLIYATIANAVIYYNENFTAKIKDLPTLLKTSSDSGRARLYLGVLSSAADYIQAQRVRNRVKRELAETLRKVDILALPSQCKTAPAIKGADPLATLYKHISPEFLSPFNLAGLPAISIPCGFSSGKLPIGLQLVGKPFDEPSLLRAAYTYQQHAKWYEKRPPI